MIVNIDGMICEIKRRALKERILVAFFVARAFSIIMMQKKNNSLILWAIDTTICVQHKTASEKWSMCDI